MFQFAKEGYPFIIFFTVVTVLSIIFRANWVTVVALVLTIFMLYFFRDPDRSAIPDINSFYAPADGKVIQIRETFEDEVLKERMIEVSIFMNAFNVHVNRVPCEGTVKEVKYFSGRFMAAFKEEASKSNEHINMVMECKQGNVMMRQVAGLLARRAVCRVKPGDTLKQGERYGLIKFSSRVDIFLPLGTDVKVQLNDKVKAGETLIGTSGQGSGDR